MATKKKKNVERQQILLPRLLGRQPYVLQHLLLSPPPLRGVLTLTITSKFCAGMMLLAGDGGVRELLKKRSAEVQKFYRRAGLVTVGTLGVPRSEAKKKKKEKGDTLRTRTHLLGFGPAFQPSSLEQ